MCNGYIFQLAEFLCSALQLLSETALEVTPDLRPMLPLTKLPEGEEDWMLVDDHPTPRFAMMPKMFALRGYDSKFLLSLFVTVL